MLAKATILEFSNLHSKKGNILYIKYFTIKKLNLNSQFLKYFKIN